MDFDHHLQNPYVFIWGSVNLRICFRHQNLLVHLQDVEAAAAECKGEAIEPSASALVPAPFLSLVVPLLVLVPPLVLITGPNR
jgi:hypothetical protein